MSGENPSQKGNKRPGEQLEEDRPPQKQRRNAEAPPSQPFEPRYRTRRQVALANSRAPSAGQSQPAQNEPAQAQPRPPVAKPSQPAAKKKKTKTGGSTQRARQPVAGPSQPTMHSKKSSKSPQSVPAPGPSQPAGKKKKSPAGKSPQGARQPVAGPSQPAIQIKQSPKSPKLAPAPAQAGSDKNQSKNASSRSRSRQPIPQPAVPAARNLIINAGPRPVVPNRDEPFAGSALEPLASPGHLSRLSQAVQALAAQPGRSSARGSAATAATANESASHSQVPQGTSATQRPPVGTDSTNQAGGQPPTGTRWEWRPAGAQLASPGRMEWLYQKVGSRTCATAPKGSASQSQVPSGTSATRNNPPANLPPTNQKNSAGPSRPNNPGQAKKTGSTSSRPGAATGAGSQQSSRAQVGSGIRRTRANTSTEPGPYTSPTSAPPGPPNSRQRILNRARARALAALPGPAAVPADTNRPIPADQTGQPPVGTHSMAQAGQQRRPETGTHSSIRGPSNRAAGSTRNPRVVLERRVRETYESVREEVEVMFGAFGPASEEEREARLNTLQEIYEEFLLLSQSSFEI
ncbi:hypothetical protein PCASD_01054 [Puccinia coronata f. sp. avenae]|uniref:Uncharacterized protein n=1 Tax=Puccinia coronata f. sp. avenae TaxID=200324 RepID=A0A2N5VMP9_9BASI|nr:hypothetical protein PCASD_01054 [Puccinia coronata f. sp. avenae]